MNFIINILNIKVMKVKNLFVLSLAALSFAACSKDDAIIDEPVVPQEGTLVVNLSSLAPVVKAEDGKETGIDDEGKLQNVYVYAFNAEGEMHGQPQVAAVKENDNTSAELTWQLPVGNYTIAAVSGLADAITGVSATELSQKVVTLANNTRANFVMYGAKAHTIVANDADGAAISNSVSLDVARVLSGVKLNNIKTDFSSNVAAEYINSTKTLTSIKIVGSKESALLNGAVNTAAEVIVENVMTKATFSEGNAVTITSQDAELPTFTTAARAYACPSTITRITIGVTYSDATIGTRYYSLAAGMSLVANTMYGLNVTITGVGSKDENNPTPVGDGNYSIKSLNWTTGTVIEGTSEY